MSRAIDWQPSATLATLATRAAMLTTVRAFFAARQVMEVETPVLCAAGVTDTHIASISATTEQGLRWLRTSPEYHMKRLLAAGSGDIYQIGKAFRNGESGRNHEAEFTLIEWYRHGFSLQDMAQETCALIIELSKLGSHPLQAVQHISYRDAFLQSCGIDPFAASTADLRAAALRHIPAFEDTSRYDANDRHLWLDMLAGALVNPTLSGDNLWVVDRFPAEQAMLARLDPADPSTAERFEVFLRGIELANGFRELRDSHEQAQRFANDRARRIAADLPDMLPDTRLLAALESGLPDCAGVAVGLDRVLLMTARLGELRETMSFAPGA